MVYLLLTTNITPKGCSKISISALNSTSLADSHPVIFIANKEGAMSLYYTTWRTVLASDCVFDHS